MRALAAVAVAVAALACCAHEELVLEPRELAHHVAELRRTGHAKVDLTPSGSAELHTMQALTVRLHGQQERAIPIGDLIAHCPDVPPFAEDQHTRDPPCLLDEIEIPPVLGHTSHLDWDIAGPVSVIAVTGGLAACTAECGHPLDVASGVTLAVGYGTLLLVGIALFAQVVGALP